MRTASDIEEPPAVSQRTEEANKAGQKKKN
jgi:hypothetical protein